MTTEALSGDWTEAAAPPRRPRDLLRQHWPLIAGLLLLAIPTLASVAKQTWSTEFGAHGPIVLATALWLLSYNKLRFLGAPGAGRLLWLPPFVVGVALYLFGRAYDFISLEAAGLYVAFVVILYLLAGWSEIRRNLFPLAAVHLLQPLGYPIAREGVTLTVAQYQLLVEDACAGMNSLTGLTAISLFYIYLMHRASWRYAALMVAMIVPIAVFVNILRVIALVLITYYFGNAAAQGFLHVTTGLVLFTLAIALMFLLDMVLQFFARRRSPTVATA
jgi:exosortase/archaeosortase family protein